MKKNLPLKAFLLVLFLACDAGLLFSQHIKILNPLKYTSSSSPYLSYDTSVTSFAVYKGICYFIATTGPQHIRGLWRSDGTSAGTYAVSSPDAGGLDFLYDVEVIDNKLYALGTYLNIFNDTAKAAIPQTLKNESANGPTNIIQLNGLEYYSTNGAIISTNGTAAGTTYMYIINSSTAAHLTLSKNNLLVNFGTYGNSVAYLSDGTKPGTMPLDISANVRQITALGDSVYFVHGDSLYINPVTASPHSSMLANNPLGAVLAKAYLNKPIPVLNGDLYFTATTPSTGMELYKYSPSGGEISLVKDIVPGEGSADIDFNTMVKAGSTLFFVASDASGNKQLWKSNGTEAGTVLVKTFDAGSNSFANFTNVNSKLFFTCSTSVSGNELWKCDGTDAGTVMVADINPGNYGSNPAFITATGSSVFFMANDGVHGAEFFKSNGTAAGTKLIKDINAAAPVAPVDMKYFTALNNRLLFSAADDIYGEELWATDGTPGGTALVKDIVPGSASGNPSGLTANGSNIYFFVDSASQGMHQLWKTDGTAAGTAVFMRFDNPAIQPFYMGASAGGYVYFLMNNSGQHELWRSDGTQGGTVFLANLASNADSARVQFTPVGDIVYYVSGNNLCKTNGAAAGTVVVQNYTGPPQLAAFKNRLVFYADQHLWVLNNNTITQADGTYPNPISFQGVIKERLFFVSDATFNGQEGNYLIALDTVGHIQPLYNFVTGDAHAFTVVNDKIWFISIGKMGIFNDSDNTVQFNAKNYAISNIIGVNGRLYFQTFNTIPGTMNVGYSDGTNDGTQLIIDSLAPFNHFYLGSLMQVNNHLAFIASPLLEFNTAYNPGLFSVQFYALALEGLLPVSLTGFTAKLQSGNALLNWSTATEQNSDYFAVQRSIDGLHFNELGKIGAAGNSSIKQSYNYTDYAVTKLGVDKVYYRLQQFDKDGKFAYSKTIPLTINLQFTASVSPVPVAGQLSVNITSLKQQTVAITIVDVNGKVLATTQKAVGIGATTLTFNTQSWAPGAYMVQLTQADGTKQTIKVVK